MIGDLRHRVSIERNDGATDAGGGKTENWSPVATVWAQIEQFAASPTPHAGRAAEQFSMRAIIRHRTDIAAGMRLTHNDNIYRIRAVADPEQRERYLALSCEREGGV